MSSLKALEDEVIRALSEATDMQTDFGMPVRVLNGETGRAAFPFVRIGRHELREDSLLEEHRISVEVFSRAGGRPEANRLTGLVANTLRTAEMSPSGINLIVFHPVFSDVFLRPDGTTFRGLLRLRAVTDVGAM